GELHEELSDFLEMAAEEKMKHGMSRKDALRAVRLERGSLEIAKEVVRSAGWESRSEEHTSELQSPCNLVCRLLLEKKNHSRSTPTYIDQLPAPDRTLCLVVVGLSPRDDSLPPAQAHYHLSSAPAPSPLSHPHVLRC